MFCLYNILRIFTGFEDIPPCMFVHIRASSNKEEELGAHQTKQLYKVFRCSKKKKLFPSVILNLSLKIELLVKIIDKLTVSKLIELDNIFSFHSVSLRNIEEIRT